MTARVRHRWTVGGTPALGQLQQHELAMDHAQLQLFTSETGQGREALLPVTFFSDRGTYAVDDIVSHDGLLWVARVAVAPGAFDEAEWLKMNEADVGTQIDDAMAAHVADPYPHPQYATDADLTAHVEAADPHPQYATDTDLSGAVPVGCAMLWFTAVAPAGWGFAQGQAISRAANPKLFALWGTTYGAGDGSSTFNVIDMRGLVPRGVDAGRGIDPGRALGTKQDHALGSHAHPVNDPGHNHPVSDPGHAHTAWTDVQGLHSHYVNDPGHVHPGGGAANQWGLRNENWATFWINQAQQPRGNNTDGAGTGIWLNSDGNHQHNVGINGAYTGIGVGNRATGITVGAAGASETRGSNFSVNFIVRLG